MGGAGRESKKTAPPSNVLTLTRPGLVLFNSAQVPEFFQIDAVAEAFGGTLGRGQSDQAETAGIGAHPRGLQIESDGCAPVLPS